MQHFNQLTPAEAERLALLAEECAEVIQVVGKILRHGYESRHPDGGPTNRELLEMELGHIVGAEQLLVVNEDVRGIAISCAYLAKREKVGRYLHHNTAPSL